MTMQKAALVTGAGTGIGKACAIRLAKHGLAVAVNYSRSQQEAEQTVNEIKKLGVPALLCKANVADDAAVRKMVDRCRDEWGGLDVLVNNAAMTYFIEPTDLEALTDQVWDDILSVNLMGAFYCCRAALPALTVRSGAIVNITSVAGLQGIGSSMPYAASKAALNCLTKSLARAFAPRVRVNAVAPGPVLTRWMVGHEDMVERSLTQTPLARAADPDDIADAVVFLALGTTLTTGQVLIVDGGRTIV